MIAGVRKGNVVSREQDGVITKRNCTNTRIERLRRRGGLVRQVVSVCCWARIFKIQKIPETAKKRTNNTKKSGD